MASNSRDAHLPTREGDEGLVRRAVARRNCFVEHSLQQFRPLQHALTPGANRNKLFATNMLLTLRPLQADRHTLGVPLYLLVR